jgi:hypothetical protein
MTSMTARIFTALIGVWQFLSALTWSRTSAGFAVTAASGLLAVLFSYLAGRVGWARYANLAVGVAVFLLSFALYRGGSPPFWNSVIVGVSIALGGLASGGPEASRHEREFYGRITA